MSNKQALFRVIAVTFLSVPLNELITLISVDSISFSIIINCRRSTVDYFNPIFQLRKNLNFPLFPILK